MPGVRQSLDGHALITGGSQGIGLQIAELLAREGCSISIVDIRDTDKAVEDIQSVSTSRKVQGLKGDVTSFGEISDATRKAEKAFGPITILVANAGILLPTAKIIDQAPEDFEKVSRVNYVGVVNTVKAALPGMLERDNGRILIMGSMSGVLGMYGIASYAATKAAVRSFADILRLEVLGTGVSVHLAQPTFVDTSMGRRCMGCMEPWLQKWTAKYNSRAYPTEKVVSNIVNGIRNKNNYLLITPGVYQIVQATAGFLAPSAFPLLFEMLIVAPLQALNKRLFRTDLERTIIANRCNQWVPRASNEKADREIPRSAGDQQLRHR